MNEHSLERVQQDLDAIRSALPSDSPYDRKRVALSALAALAGIPFALRAMPGWERVSSVALIAALGSLGLLYASWLRRAQAERGSRPRRWSLARDEIVSGAIAVGALIIYALLKRYLSPGDEGWDFKVWRSELAGPGLFATGVWLFAMGITRPERRVFLGWGLALLVLGGGMPWVESRDAFRVAGGLAMTLGGILSTLLIWRQVRETEGTHVGN